MLHLEIVTERLRREANLSLIVTTPTITYEVETEDHKKRIIYSPSLFPEFGTILKVWEPYCMVEIIVPGDYLGA
jgi:GTP-binding protein LepA